MNGQSQTKIRSFIAYTLPQEVITLCIKIQSQFPDGRNSLKLVKPENMHLTILFLGDKTIEELKSIKNSLSRIISKIKEVNFTATRISVFGRPPSVIYLETSDKENKGKLLAEKIYNELNTIPDKPWIAHITLARIKPYSRKFDATLLKNKNIKFKPISFSPSGIVLLTSQLTSKGPIYKVFHRNINSV